MVGGESMEQTNSDVDKQSNGSVTDEDELTDEELTESLIERSYKWPQLKQLVFKYNYLKKIDRQKLSKNHAYSLVEDYN